MDRIGIREARKTLAYLCGKRVMLESRGRPVAGLVRPEEAELIEALERSGALDEMLEQLRGGESIR